MGGKPEGEHNHRVVFPELERPGGILHTYRYGSAHTPSTKSFRSLLDFLYSVNIFHGAIGYQIVDFHRRHHERTVIKDGKRYQGHTSSERSDNSSAGKPGCAFPHIFGIIFIWIRYILLFLNGKGEELETATIFYYLFDYLPGPTSGISFSNLL